MGVSEAIPIVFAARSYAWYRFAQPNLRTCLQSFRNTIDAIQPVISAMNAVTSP